jgi:hypothetical protein
LLKIVEQRSNVQTFERANVHAVVENTLWMRCEASHIDIGECVIFA